MDGTEGLGARLTAQLQPGEALGSPAWEASSRRGRKKIRGADERKIEEFAEQSDRGGAFALTRSLYKD